MTIDNTFPPFTTPIGPAPSAGYSFNPSSVPVAPWVSSEIVGALRGMVGAESEVCVYVMGNDDPYRGVVNEVGVQTVALHSTDVNADFPGTVVSFIRLDQIVSVEFKIAQD